MKKVIAIAALTAILGSGRLQAGESLSPEEIRQKAQEKVQKLTDELKLTSEQQSKIRDAVQRSKERMQQLKQDARREIRDILTPEQQSKFDQMKD